MLTSGLSQNKAKLQNQDLQSSTDIKQLSINDFNISTIADFEKVVIALLSDPEITEEWEVEILTEFATYFSKRPEKLSKLLEESKTNEKIFTRSYTEQDLLHWINIVSFKFFELWFHVWMGVADEELQWHNHKYPMASLCLWGGYSQQVGRIHSNEGE